MANKQDDSNYKDWLKQIDSDDTKENREWYNIHQTTNAPITSNPIRVGGKNSDRNAKERALSALSFRFTM